MRLTFELAQATHTEIIEADLQHCIVAGWAGRDQAAIEQLRLGQAPLHTGDYLLQHRELTVTAEPVLRGHTRRNVRQTLRQTRLGGQHLIHPPGKARQGLGGIVAPIQRQAVIEKHIQQDAAITPPLNRKTCPRLRLQRVAVGEHIDAPMQVDRRFDIRRPLPGQRPFDEIAIQAAQQLCRRIAAEV